MKKNKEREKQVDKLLAKKLMYIFGQVLSSRHKKNNMKQREVAAEMGVSEGYLSRKLGDPTENITLRTIVKMELALGQDIITTPNDYDAFLIRNYKKIVRLARALFENKVPEEDRIGLITELNDFVQEKKMYLRSKSDTLVSVPIYEESHLVGADDLVLSYDDKNSEKLIGVREYEGSSEELPLGVQAA